MSPWEVFGKSILWLIFMFTTYAMGWIDASDDTEPYGFLFMLVLGFLGLLVLVLPTVAGYGGEL